MDPRLYTYERRTPRLNNPTFKSQFVTDSLLIFKGGPLGSSSLKNDYKNIIQTNQKTTNLDLSYNPSEISKIRASFQNNRSKGKYVNLKQVPLSNLSSYARQVMFPIQRQPNMKIQGDYLTNKPTNPETFIKPQLYLDSKEQNYIKTICKMNDQFLSKSRFGTYQNSSSDSIEKTNRSAGKPSFMYDDKDRRYYRYKHSYDDEISKNLPQKTKSYSLNKSFVPSRLNYADQLKGIL